MNALLFSLALLSATPPPVETAAVPSTRLYVRTVPPGATVILDGKPLGKSDGLFLAPAGTARIEIVLDGRAPEVRRVEVAEGRITRIVIELKPAGAGDAGKPGNAQATPTGPWGGIAPAAPRRDAARLAPGRGGPPPKPEEEGPVEKALAQKADLDFKDARLPKVLQYLRDRYKINVSVDKRSLADAGLSEESISVTISLSGVPLRSALKLALAERGLTFIVRDRVLLITTPEAANSSLSTKTYPISDLTSSGNELAQVMVAVVGPTSWENVGGPGSVRYDGAGALVILQTQEIHRRIAGFLADLRIVASQPVARFPLAVSHEGYWRQTPETEAIRKALDKPLSFNFKDAPLAEKVVEYLKAQLGVNVIVDRKALADAGISEDSRLTVNLKGVPAGQGLSLALAELGLTYAVRDDVLLVTTPENEDELLSTAVYPVADLIASGRTAEDLADIVTSTVAPTSWDDVGGPGAAIGLSGAVDALAVSQTTENHLKIADLLGQLRRQRAGNR